MPSKKSYFSKTIFLKNITHYWPIWSCWLLVCLYRLPFRIYISLSTDFQDIAPTEYESFREQQFLEAVYNALNPTMLFLFSAIAAIALFSYLYQARSANMIHALPVCRESLFLSNVSSGLCFLMVPQLIAFLTSIFVCFFLRMTHLEGLLHWLLLSLGITLTAFSLAVFAAMITGHTVAALALFGILNFAFVAVRSQVLLIMSALSYGMTTDFDLGDMLSPLLFLVRRFGSYNIFWGSGEAYNDFRALKLNSSYFYVGIYVVAALLLFVLTYLIYRKKQLETAGDIITVGFLKPVIRWGSAFVLGSFLAYMCAALFRSFSPAGGNLLPLIPLLLVAELAVFFAAEMLLAKSFRVFCRRRLIEGGALAGATLVFLLFIHVDLLHLERRIPAEEEIEMACINGDFPLRLAPEDYGELLSLHQDFLDNKKEIQRYFKRLQSDMAYTSLNIYYYLKNGSRLTRQYFFPVEERYLEQEDYVLHRIGALSSRPEYYLQHHFTDAYEQVAFVDGSIDVYSTGNYLDSVPLNPIQCAKIYQALRQDIAEGNYQIYSYSLYDQAKDKMLANTLFLDYTVPPGSTYIFYDGEQHLTTDKAIQSTSLTLTTDCVHTLEVLKELKILTDRQQLITQEEYKRMLDDQFREDQEKVFHQ